MSKLEINVARFKYVKKSDLEQMWRLCLNTEDYYYKYVEIVGIEYLNVK